MDVTMSTLAITRRVQPEKMCMAMKAISNSMVTVPTHDNPHIRNIKPAVEYKVMYRCSARCMRS